MHSEIQFTHCSYRRSLHWREVPQERITQNSEYQQAQLRVQWQIEELMVTSLNESFQETWVQGKLLSGNNSKRLLFKAKCGRQWQPVIPGKPGGNQTCQGSGGTKHEEESWGEHLALLICSCTTMRNGLFATVYADRKSWFTIPAIASRRRQSVGTISIDFHCFIGHAIGYRWKYLKKG